MIGPFPKPSDDAPARRWFVYGLQGVFSIPALILISSFIGFGALTRELGWSAWEASLITASIWALPSQVVYVGAVASGASAIATIIAVALSAIRLLPMTVALVPVIRDKSFPTPFLYVVSHFVAITGWVVTMRFAPEIPRHARAAFFSGIGLALWSTNVVVTAVSHTLTGAMPALLTAALYFMVAIYFLTSLTVAARFKGEVFALFFGLVLGPAFTLIYPQLDILLAGLIGGTLGYVIHAFSKKHVVEAE